MEAREGPEIQECARGRRAKCNEAYKKFVGKSPRPG